MAQMQTTEEDLIRQVQEKEDKYDTLKGRVQNMFPGFDFS